jgi:hypothetical protein
MCICVHKSDSLVCNRFINSVSNARDRCTNVVRDARRERTRVSNGAALEFISVLALFDVLYAPLTAAGRMRVGVRVGVRQCCSPVDSPASTHR